MDPIIEEALRRRPPTAEPAGPRHGHEGTVQLSSGEGGLGWPGEPRDGTGLGWPADLLTQAVPSSQEPTVAPEVEDSPVRRRSGWRRLFGSTAA